MTEQALVGRARARDVGIIVGTMLPGPLNAITDIVGVRVGHTTLIRGSGSLKRGVGPVRTGVTAILPRGDNLFTSKVPAAATVFNGFGKTIGLMQIAELGQLETPILLTNTLSVGQVADALVAYMLEHNSAIGVTTGTVNPVVCECNDGYLNDNGGRHVGEQDVWAAIAHAAEGHVPEGNVGAGTGMTAYGFAGGIGVPTFFPPRIPAKAPERSRTGLSRACLPVALKQRKQCSELFSLKMGSRRASLQGGETFEQSANQA